MEFFAFGALGFWILIAIMLIIIAFFINDGSNRENDYGVLGIPITFSLICMVILYASYSKDFNNLFREIVWLYVILGVVGYVVVGILWSFFKWYCYNGILYREWKQYGSRQENKGGYIPLVSKNKARISSWIVFWPISMIRHLVNDMVTDLVSSIVEWGRTRYELITIKRFGK